MSETDVTLRRAAMDLLARREHSRRELHAKLKGRADSCDAIESVLDALEADRLLSDQRFAESFARARMNRGYGPVRIRQELQQKGVDSESIAQVMSELEADWFELCSASREKKFGEFAPVDNRDRARQMRYLQYRGFDGDAIREALASVQLP